MPPSNKTVTHAKGSFQRIVLTMLIKVMIAGDKPTYQSNCVVRECSLDIKNGPTDPLFGWWVQYWACGPVGPFPVARFPLESCSSCAPKTEDVEFRFSKVRRKLLH